MSLRVSLAFQYHPLQSLSPSPRTSLLQIQIGIWAFSSPHQSGPFLFWVCSQCARGAICSKEAPAFSCSSHSSDLQGRERERERGDGGVRQRQRQRQRVQVLGGAIPGRAGAHLPQPAAAGGARGGAQGVQGVEPGGGRAVLLAGDRHRGVEPAAAEQAGAARPHGGDAPAPELRLLPPHQRLRGARRPALLLHRRPCTSSEDVGDTEERDQRQHRGERGAEVAQRHVPGHQQLHQDGRSRAGGVRQALPVPRRAPAGHAPHLRRRQGMPARRGPRHRPHHAQAPPPRDGLHARHHRRRRRGPLQVPRPRVPGPPRLLGRRREVLGGTATRPHRPGPARRRLLREQLLGGVLRLLRVRRRRRGHLLVGAHGRRLLRRRRQRRRRGHLGRRPGPREPRGQVLWRRFQRELCRFRLATVTMR